MAIAALVSTLAFGVLAGVVIRIGLSLLWLIAVATHPNIVTLVREAGTDVFRDPGEDADDEIIPGVVVMRMDGGLFFATSDALEDRLREIIHSNPDLTGVVLDCAGVNFIDSQGSDKMNDLVTLARESGVTLRLARVKASVSATLARDNVLQRIGAGTAPSRVSTDEQRFVPDGMSLSATPP